MNGSAGRSRALRRQGKFNHLLVDDPATTTLEGLVNNDVKAFTYLDLGVQLKAGEDFTLSFRASELIRGCARQHR
jgi:hypothetical protein